MKKIFFYTVLCLFFFSKNTHSQTLNLEWQFVEMGLHIGDIFTECIDIDGDGTQEIITCNRTNLFVLDYKNGIISQQWVSRGYVDDAIRDVEIYNFDNDEDYEIYLVAQNGFVEIYDGKTGDIIESDSTGADDPRSFVVVDLNNDGLREYVLTGDDNGTIVFNPLTDEIIWQDENLSGHTIQAGQMDNDPQLEIAFCELFGVGYIVDGSNFQIQWEHPEGFGNQIQLFNLDNDSQMEIVGKRKWDELVGFDLQTQSEMWVVKPEHDVNNFRIIDLEGDGNFEMIYGGRNWRAYGAYDLATKQLLWHHETDDDRYTHFAVGDPDNDGKTELIYGTSNDFTTSDHLIIRTLENFEEEFRSLQNGPSSLMALGDVLNDGTQNLLINWSFKEPNFTGSRIVSMNPLTHEIEYETTEKPSVWPPSSPLINLSNFRDKNQTEYWRGGLGYDGRTNENIYQIPSVYDFTTFADVDGDLVQEIIGANGNDKVSIYKYNGLDFELDWTFIPTFNSMVDMVVGNVDEDLALEIIVLHKPNRFTVVDAVSLDVEWVETSLPVEMYSIAVGDLYSDGKPKILTGDANGGIYIYDGISQSFEIKHDIGDEVIRDFEILNVDNNPEKEIFVRTGNLSLHRSSDFSVIWESEHLGSSSTNMGLEIADLDGDNKLDFYTGGYFVLRHYEADFEYVDFEPPFVKNNFPKNFDFEIGLDAPIIIDFSEEMDASSINNSTILVSNQNNDLIDCVLNYDAFSNRLIITPIDSFPQNTTIKVTISNQVTDINGNLFDGNKNQFASGDSSDDFIFFFTTSSEFDDVGPEVKFIILSTDFLWESDQIIMEGTAADLLIPASSGVAQVEFFRNKIGVFGNGTQIVPEDGRFDEKSEKVVAKISTKGWTKGEHILHFHAKDNNGNWGSFNSVSITILKGEVGDWSSFGQNPQNTNSNKDMAIVPPLKPLWTKNFSGYERVKNLTCLKDRLYVTAHENVFFDREAIFECLDTETGEKLWGHEWEELDNIMPPAIGNGRAFIQTEINTTSVFLESFLWSFDIETGEELWTHPIRVVGQPQLGPVVVDGKVFTNAGFIDGFSAANYGISCFDAFSGNRLWNREIEWQNNVTPAIHNEVLYVFIRGKLTAFDFHTGTVQWELEGITENTSGFNPTPVLVDEYNNILIITTTTKTTAVDIESRKVIWEKEGTFGIHPALAQNQLFTINNRVMEVLDPKTGDLLWKLFGDKNLKYSPVVAKKHVYVSSQFRIYAANIETQDSLWQMTPGGGNLILGDHKLFVVSDNGNGKVSAFYSETLDQPTDTLPPNDNLIILDDFNTLKQKNYPNPASSYVIFEFELEEKSKVKIQIFNSNGRLINTLLEQEKAKGIYQYNWDSSTIAPGHYYYKIETNSGLDDGKIIIQR